MYGTFIYDVIFGSGQTRLVLWRLYLRLIKWKKISYLNFINIKGNLANLRQEGKTSVNYNNLLCQKTQADSFKPSSGVNYISIDVKNFNFVFYASILTISILNKLNFKQKILRSTLRNIYIFKYFRRYFKKSSCHRNHSSIESVKLILHPPLLTFRLAWSTEHTLG